MNYKIAVLTFSTTLFLGGCASMGQEGRIGKNDGSDLCFRYLETIDSVAMYYKDERLKQLTMGAAIGTASGAALGVGTAALVKGDMGIGALVGGIAGGITGAFLANNYWDNRMKQANQQVSLAKATVENDLREDIQKISSIDNNILELVRCRTQQRDAIRRQFADGKLSSSQAQLEWQKWGELVKKDQAEMQYLGEALNNIQKIEQSYSYAANVIESGGTAPNQQYTTTDTQYEDDPVVEEGSSVLKKGKKSKGKHKAKAKTAHGSSTGHPKKVKGKKAARNSGKITTMVSSMHEKFESIKKNKNDHEKLVMDANNPKGFERIESHYHLDWNPAATLYLSAMLNTPAIRLMQDNGIGLPIKMSLLEAQQRIFSVGKTIL